MSWVEEVVGNPDSRIRELLQSLLKLACGERNLGVVDWRGNRSDSRIPRKLPPHLHCWNREKGEDWIPSDTKYSIHSLRKDYFCQSELDWILLQLSQYLHQEFVNQFKGTGSD